VNGRDDKGVCALRFGRLRLAKGPNSTEGRAKPSLPASRVASVLERRIDKPAAAALSAGGGEAARRLRLIAVGLMCAAAVFFSGIDSSAKWLSVHLPASEIIWARYVGAAVFSLFAARPLSRPRVLLSRAPGVQIMRSVLLLCSTVCSFFALSRLQLAETSTISFLSPLFVALLAGPWLGERIGVARAAAIAVGFLGVLIAVRPGTAAFQPVVLVSITGVFCNALYVLATRALAGRDLSETTLAWTPLAGVIALTPVLPWTWQTPDSALVWGVMGVMGLCGGLGHWLLILAHHRAPASVLAPFGYTQLIWMIVLGALVFGDWPPVAMLVGAGIVIASNLFLVWRERGGEATVRRPAAS
jgi:drug/metabolite transporter (DMT)-like permease